LNLNPGLNLMDKSQRLIDRSVTEDLSFHKIYFKTDYNFLSYFGDKHTQKGKQELSHYLRNFLTEVIMIMYPLTFKN